MHNQEKKFLRQNLKTILLWLPVIKFCSCSVPTANFTQSLLLSVLKRSVVGYSTKNFSDCSSDAKLNFVVASLLCLSLSFPAFLWPKNLWGAEENELQNSIIRFTEGLDSNSCMYIYVWGKTLDKQVTQRLIIKFIKGEFMTITLKCLNLFQGIGFFF